MIKAKPVLKPLVYSCSGCSSVAQMTNYLAIQLDRKGIAEMSCIAGVGGNVKTLLHKAQSGRKIIVIDGCSLACSRVCLQNHKILPEMYFELTSFGVKKNFHQDFDLNEAKKILEILELSIAKGKEKLNGGLFADDMNKGNRYLSLPVSAQSEIVIQEVLTKKQQQDFINFPHRLYRNNKFYVPQLKNDVDATFDSIKNPAFEFCEAKRWLAYDGDKVVGRIAGIINYAFMEKWKKRYMRFGWIDFEDNGQVANALLFQVENWAREKGMTAIHGPLGFTNFDYAGLLVEGFDQLGTFATSYNYPYYTSLLEKNEYQKDVDWVEFKIKLPELMPEKLDKIAAIVGKRYQLHVLRVKKTKELLPYARDIFHLLNDTYDGLFGMVSLSDQQIGYYTGKYLSFISPDFVSLVFDKNNTLAAFCIAMPSLSGALQKTKGMLYPFGFVHILKAFRKNNMADLCLIAVRKDMQGKGVNAILMKELTASFLKRGIRYAESNPELESNTKVQSLWEYYDTVQHKRRRCYIKYLK